MKQTDRKKRSASILALLALCACSGGGTRVTATTAPASIWLNRPPVPSVDTTLAVPALGSCHEIVQRMSRNLTRLAPTEVLLKPHGIFLVLNSSGRLALGFDSTKPDADSCVGKLTYFEYYWQPGSKRIEFNFPNGPIARTEMVRFAHGAQVMATNRRGVQKTMALSLKPTLISGRFHGTGHFITITYRDNVCDRTATEIDGAKALQLYDALEDSSGGPTLVRGKGIIEPFSYYGC